MSLPHEVRTQWKKQEKPIPFGIGFLFSRAKEQAQSSGKFLQAGD